MKLHKRWYCDVIGYLLKSVLPLIKSAGPNTHLSGKRLKKLCRTGFKAANFACNMTKRVCSGVKVCVTHRAETVGIPSSFGTTFSTLS